MNRQNKYLASLFVSAALVAPMGAFAMAAPQDDRDHERHEERERENRVYDSHHKDYHNWDQREDQTYRHWLEDRHQGYVEFNGLRERDQRAYWNWRHSHAEHEENEHRDHQ